MKYVRGDREVNGKPKREKQKKGWRKYEALLMIKLINREFVKKIKYEVGVSARAKEKPKSRKR